MAKKGEDTRRMPIRKARVELDGEFGGWWAEGRANISPMAILEYQTAMTGFDLDEAATASERTGMVRNLYEGIYVFLERVLLPHGEWNFVDEKGEKLSLSRDSIRSLPMELTKQLHNRFYEAVVVLPPGQPPPSRTGA